MTEFTKEYVDRVEFIKVYKDWNPLFAKLSFVDWMWNWELMNSNKEVLYLSDKKYEDKEMCLTNCEEMNEVSRQQSFESSMPDLSHLE